MVKLALDPPPFRPGHQPSKGGGRTLLSIGFIATAALGFFSGRFTAPGGKFPITVSGRSGAAASGESAPGSTPPAGAPAPDPGAHAAGQPGVTAPLPPGVTGPELPGVTAPPALPGGNTPAPPGGLAAAVQAAPAVGGPHRIVAALDGALEDTVTRALPPEDRGLAERLTQVVNRLLVWDLAVARDGRKGDRIEVLYHPAPPVAPGLAGSGEPVVDALRFVSQKLGKTFAVYRFQAGGQKWPHYYRTDGSELEERFVDAPVGDYDQVTSLLRDGRRHKGVDFRTPTGTPVFATFDGIVERRNWNFGGNGNCLDIRDAASGRHAIYLHLDVLPKEMTPGRRVKKGEQIAHSGNSGRSFAPHLHYQLEAPDGRILDPFAVQATRRAGLDAPGKAAFEAVRAKLDAALAGAVAAR
jgi:murein DD-endopeptidase